MTFQGTLLSSLVQICPAVWEEMFKKIIDDARRTMDDGYRTILKAPVEHVQLEKHEMWYFFFFFDNCL